MIAGWHVYQYAILFLRERRLCARSGHINEQKGVGNLKTSIQASHRILLASI
ncbi:Uncharacterised protein [Enterobacter cloacae]|jgi:hypothetical protein|nr:Uncharacterised protein [Enterobacter cloacae]